jgi:spectinomycin phosphotransferase
MICHVLEDPGLDHEQVLRALHDAYGSRAAALAFIPGYDAHSASYDVAADDGRSFLKIHFGTLNEASLEVPAALLDAGMPNVLAPIRTSAAMLWAPMDRWKLVLYPFVSGRSAMDVGLTEEQWRTFGGTLRAVHDSGLELRFADRLPTDFFALPSRGSVHRALELASKPTSTPSARRLAGLLQSQSDRIGQILARTDELASALRERPLERVLCHADIHAANILVADDTAIFLVDWDGPMLAPRERDLLFVIGSRIARAVELHEERWFFEGYGEVSVERDALIFYRYERILEDIGEFAASVFLDPDISEDSRRRQTDLVESFFAPGDVIDSAEVAGQSLMP